MNYKQTITYLYEQLPCYQKIGKSAYKGDLLNTIELLQSINNPEKKLRCIHIAGTNGKGSTSHITASILQEAGYSVGLYTSPHLLDFRERISINGNYISKKFVIHFVEKIKKHIPHIKPSFFEITVAMAFDYFAEQNVDFAVIETGLGGRLDSTNVITPILSVITNIGLDHTNLLGNTIQEIAKEKAGIIKENIPIIIGESNKDIEDIFIQKAFEKNAEIVFADTIFRMHYTSISSWYSNFSILKDSVEIVTHLQSPFHGKYQIKNIQTVIAICDSLQQQKVRINKSNIKRGLKKCIINNSLLGRWQIISTNPNIVCDTAHNFDGVKEITEQLELLQTKDLHIIWGMVNDKDVSKIIPLLPSYATYYITKPSIERGLDENELAKYFINHSYKVFHSVKQAYKAAIRNSTSTSVVYIGGSTFVVADFLKHIRASK